MTFSYFFPPVHGIGPILSLTFPIDEINQEFLYAQFNYRILREID